MPLLGVFIAYLTCCVVLVVTQVGVRRVYTAVSAVGQDAQHVEGDNQETPRVRVQQPSVPTFDLCSQSTCGRVVHVA